MGGTVKTNPNNPGQTDREKNRPGQGSQSGQQSPRTPGVAPQNPDQQGGQTPRRKDLDFDQEQDLEQGDR